MRYIRRKLLPHIRVFPDIFVLLLDCGDERTQLFVDPDRLKMIHIVCHLFHRCHDTFGQKMGKQCAHREQYDRQTKQ